MPSTLLQPRKALNKAYLKVKPNRQDIEKFKTQLIGLLDSINEKESEEFHKNLVINFLKKTWYDPSHFVNTKGRPYLAVKTTEDYMAAQESGIDPRLCQTHGLTAKEISNVKGGGQ